MGAPSSLWCWFQQSLGGSRYTKVLRSHRSSLYNYGFLSAHLPQSSQPVHWARVFSSVAGFSHCQSISSCHRHYSSYLHSNAERRNYSSTAQATATVSSPKEELIISDTCVRRLQQITKGGAEGERKMLRVIVEGGGCSGFQYLFKLEDKIKADDRIFQKEGVKVVVDELSFNFLKGATIDYVEELIRSAFMVTENPNASAGCSCGSSFVAK